MKGRKDGKYGLCFDNRCVMQIARLKLAKKIHIFFEKCVSSDKYLNRDHLQSEFWPLWDLLYDKTIQTQQHKSVLYCVLYNEDTYIDTITLSEWVSFNQ